MGHGPVRSRAQRTLLAALVLNLGRTVSTDRLADLIWGDAQPQNPSAALQNHVSRIRKILPRASTVISDATGYRLEVADGSCLDVSLFDDSFEAVCESPVEHRLAALEAGLALWRGRPFADLDDDLDAASAKSRLCDLHTAFEEMRAETLLTLGRVREATAELERLRHTHPLRETLAELLMNAHVGGGRKADALAAYRSLQGALVEQLGLDPSPRLQRLQMAILSNEESKHSAGDLGRPGSQPAARLPPPASTFVGRQQEILQLTELMQQHRLMWVGDLSR